MAIYDSKGKRQRPKLNFLYGADGLENRLTLGADQFKTHMKAVVLSASEESYIFSQTQVNFYKFVGSSLNHFYYV